MKHNRLIMLWWGPVLSLFWAAETQDLFFELSSHYFSTNSIKDIYIKAVQSRCLQMKTYCAFLNPARTNKQKQGQAQIKLSPAQQG